MVTDLIPKNISDAETVLVIGLVIQAKTVKVIEDVTSVAHYKVTDAVQQNVKDSGNIHGVIKDADYMKSIETIVAYVYLESYYEEDDVEVKKVDKREREIQRKVRANENFYLRKVLKSNRKIWDDPSRLKSDLPMSHCPRAEKILKDRRRRNREMNNDSMAQRKINFISGGMMTEMPSIKGATSKIRISDLKLISHSTKAGLGSHLIKYENAIYIDPCPLTDSPDEKLTAEHLEKIESVAIVEDHWDTKDIKQKMIYFLHDNTTRVLPIEDLLIKSNKELKFVQYLLRVTNETTALWSRMILNTIRRRMVDGDGSYTGEYTPSYTDYSLKEVPMQKKSAKVSDSEGSKYLHLNPRGTMPTYISFDEIKFQFSTNTTIRAALFQIDDDDEEQKILKDKLIKYLKSREDKRLARFLSESNVFQVVNEQRTEDL